MNKEIFIRMSSWSQLFFLCLFSFVGLMIAAVLTVVIGGATGSFESLDFMKVMQVVQVVLIFLIPSLLCAYLFHKSAPRFLKINKPIDVKFLLLSILLIFAVQPFIAFTGHYNSMITLPESLAGIEKMMKMMEEQAQTLIEKMLTTNSVLILLINLFVIAITAGVTEEFFFRGSMQQTIRKICKNRHLAVWITAFIFSFIHLQFYGFVPRLLLGALLGYIFLWSGNLWIAVIVHAINNTIGVLTFHFFHNTPIYEKLENFGVGNTVWATVVSVILTGTILAILSREYQKNNPQDFTI